MADERYDDGSKYGEFGYADEASKAPDQHGEVAQRRANKAKHSERVMHGGNVGSGSKER